MDYRAENEAHVRAMQRYMTRRRFRGLMEALFGAAIAAAALIARGSVPDQILLTCVGITGLIFIGDGISTFIRPEPTLNEPPLELSDLDIALPAETPETRQ